MAEALFDVPEDIIYLNNAGVGARLHAVTAAGLDAVATSAHPWTGNTDDWFAAVETLRALAASTFGTETRALAYIPSASYGMAVAAHNLPLAADETVIMLAGEYPSNRSIWQVQAETAGARCIEVAPEAGEDWTAAVLRAIDARTAVISVPPCYWCDGAPLDLFAIRNAARAHGAALVVDASQALGAVPIDLDALSADFVACVGHKWLLGAYGLGWLWTAPHWRDHGTPLEETWLARELRGDSNAQSKGLTAYREGAARFDAGSSAHPMLLPMADAAMRQLHAWGIDKVAEQLGALTRHLEQRMAAAGLGELMGRPHLPHLCAIQPPAERLDDAARALHAGGVMLSRRGDGLRVAPHRHVSTKQLDRVVALLAETL